VRVMTITLKKTFATILSVFWTKPTRKVIADCADSVDCADCADDMDDLRRANCAHYTGAARIHRALYG